MSQADRAYICFGRLHRVRLPQREIAMRFALVAVVMLALSPVGLQAKSSGGYTNAQASRGATVYAQYCGQCHGANLQGESGPALTGQTFGQAYGAGTAAQLYDFISRQM